MTTAHFIFFAVILINILILIWWEKGCKWETDCKFPTRGHSLLIIIASCVPILNIVLLTTLIIVYISNRYCGYLILKENKFNKFWFGVGDDTDE